MEMLRKEDASVVAWLPRGDAFSVRDTDRFVKDILPRYFRHTKVSYNDNDDDDIDGGSDNAIGMQHKQFWTA